MEPTPASIAYTERAARSRAKRLRIDPDIAVSLGYDYLMDQASEVDDENILLTRVNYCLKTRLLADYFDELRLYGPRSTTQRQHRYRGYVSGAIQRVPPEQMHGVIVRNNTHDFDFLDQLDSPLQSYALLLLAGYTQTELIAEFGFTRSRLDTLKKDLADVLTLKHSGSRLRRSFGSD